LPSILVGIRYALGIAWIILIVAETLSATSGIGYLAANAREFLQTDIVVLSILLYAALGKRWMWPPAHWKSAGCAGIRPISRPPEESMMKLDDLKTASPILLQGLSRRFGERVVLDALDLHIPQGQFLAIVGRSGCGKEHLAAFAGRAGSGRWRPVAAAGRAKRAGDVSGSPPAAVEKRAGQCGAGLAGQSPWRAEQALAEVGLADRAQEWPARLSGGQRQRVALARALVHQPSLLLLDEPLGALDALTRLEMQGLIERLWQQHGCTTVLVTHDVSEAVTLADRVVLLEEGRWRWICRWNCHAAATRPIAALWRWSSTSCNACCKGLLQCAIINETPLASLHFAAALGLVTPLHRKQIMSIQSINVRNQFKGVIKEIIEGPVLSEVDVETASGIVTSVITTRSVRELQLKVGSPVVAFVKSTEVSIATLA
jgi:sulfonate transport system ATP-binding protein